MYITLFKKIDLFFVFKEIKFLKIGIIMKNKKTFDWDKILRKKNSAS